MGFQRLVLCYLDAVAPLSCFIEIGNVCHDHAKEIKTARRILTNLSYQQTNIGVLLVSDFGIPLGSHCTAYSSWNRPPVVSGFYG
jgi:hypothetical protein